MIGGLSRKVSFRRKANASNVRSIKCSYGFAPQTRCPWIHKTNDDAPNVSQVTIISRRTQNSMTEHTFSTCTRMPAQTTGQRVLKFPGLTVEESEG